jgi:hypothetical protein
LTAHPANANGLTALLAQYTALRDEIVHRLAAQQAIFGLHIAANGALLGVVLGGQVPRVNLLLASPLLSSVLGLAYADHTRRISIMGTYIRIRLWPEVCGRAGTALPAWEEAFKHGMTLRTPLQALISSFYIATLFVIVPLSAMVYAVVEQNFRTGEWVLWTVGLALLAFYAAIASTVALRVGIEKFALPAELEESGVTRRGGPAAAPGAGARQSAEGKGPRCEDLS